MKNIIAAIQKQRSIKEKLKAQKVNIPFKKKLVQKLRMFDMYGEPIQLCFEGNPKFKTVIGAIFSLAMSCLLLTYFSYKAIDLLTLTNFNYNTSSEVIDISNINHNLSYDEFKFEFALTKEILPEYGHIELLQQYYQAPDSSLENCSKLKLKNKYELALENIHFSKCNHTKSTGSNQQEMIFYCPSQNKTYNIGGSEFYQEKLKFVTFNIYKCVGKTKSGKACKNDTEINNYFRDNSFYLALRNSYLDSNNFTDPIKYFPDDKFFWYFATSQQQISYLYIQVNKVQLVDNFIWGTSSNHDIIQIFNQVNSIKDITPSLGVMLTIEFRLDNIRQTYSREVYQFIALMGDVGGIKSALFSLGFFISTYINRKLLYASLIKKVYQVQKKQDNQITEEKNKRRKRKVEPLQSEDQDEEEENYKNAVKDDDSLNKIIEKYNPKEKKQKQKKDNMFTKLRELVAYALSKQRQKIDVQDFIKQYWKKLYTYIIDRKYLNYKAQNYAKYLCSCLFLRTKENLRSTNNTRTHFMFWRGERKLQHELDIVTLIKSIRQLSLLSQVLLNENQRMMIKYQRANVIDSSSSSSGESDLEFEKIAKSKDMNLREFFHDTIKASLVHFHNKADKLSQVDKRIIAGLVFRKVRTHQLKLKAQGHEPDDDDDDHNLGEIQLVEGLNLSFQQKVTSISKQDNNKEEIKVEDFEDNIQTRQGTRQDSRQDLNSPTLKPTKVQSFRKVNIVKQKTKHEEITFKRVEY